MRFSNSEIPFKFNFALNVFLVFIFSPQTCSSLVFAISANSSFIFSFAQIKNVGVIQDSTLINHVQSTSKSFWLFFQSITRIWPLLIGPGLNHVFSWTIAVASYWVGYSPTLSLLQSVLHTAAIVILLNKKVISLRSKFPRSFSCQPRQSKALLLVYKVLYDLLPSDLITCPPPVTHSFYPHWDFSCSCNSGPCYLLRTFALAALSTKNALPQKFLWFDSSPHSHVYLYEMSGRPFLTTLTKNNIFNYSIFTLLFFLKNTLPNTHLSVFPLECGLHESKILSVLFIAISQPYNIAWNIGTLISVK